jgi:hypothetical protein
MVAPSVGPSTAQPLALGPTAASPPSVDRAAPTNSFVPDVLPAPQQDTNAVLAGFDPTLASNASNPAPPVQPSAFRWPPEQPAARSEEPQVRTLSGLPPLPKHPIAPVLAAVVLMVLLALASVVLVVVRLRSPSSDISARRPTVTTASLTPPPAPQPVVVMPAPTLAPPALEDTSAPSATPPASASSVAPRPVVTSKPSLPATRPPPTTVAPARPGPGF